MLNSIAMTIAIVKAPTLSNSGSFELIKLIAAMINVNNIPKIKGLLLNVVMYRLLLVPKV